MSFRDRYFRGAFEVDQTQELSVSEPTQRTVFDAVTGKQFPAVAPTDTLDTLVGRFGSSSVVWLGGILNIGAILQIHGISTLHDPLRLKYVKAALEGGKGARINYDYVGSLYATMMRAEQEKGPGTFRKIHGYGPDDFEEMPYQVALGIGRTKESRDAGIWTPNWSIVHWQSDGRLVEVYHSAPVPFDIKDTLPCAAVCYMARSVLNPKMIAWTGIGDRFYASALANGFFAGVSTVAYPGREGAEWQAIPGLAELIEKSLAIFDEAAAQGPIQAASFLIIGKTKGGRPISADEVISDFVHA